MSSRICEVRDAVIDRLQAGIAARDPGSATVTASRQISVAFDAPTARTVFVLPAAYRQVESATRTTDLSEYAVFVAVVDRYAGEGDPPDSFADDLSAWVETNVFDPLQVIGVRDAADVPAGTDPAPLLSGPDTPGLWCEVAEVLTECDPEILVEHRLFWSELTFTFREVA